MLFLTYQTPAMPLDVYLAMVSSELRTQCIGTYTDPPNIQPSLPLMRTFNLRIESREVVVNVALLRRLCFLHVQLES